MIALNYLVEGDRGAEFRENRRRERAEEGGGREAGEGGRTGGGKRERAGEQGAGSGIFMRARSGSRNKEGDSLLFITGYYSVKNFYLTKF